MGLTYDEAMAEATALGLMTAKDEATERCQCPTCSQVFSTDGNFRRHLSRNRYAKTFDGPWCRPPAEVGLIQTAGTWHLPGSDDAADPHSRSLRDGRTARRPKARARA